MASFDLIATQTVGSGGAASIQFNSIPQTYTDLCVKLSWRQAGNVNTGADAKWTINSNTSSYAIKYCYGYNGTAYANSGSANFGIVVNQSNTLASSFSNTELYFPNYTSSNYKSMLSQSLSADNTGANFIVFTAGSWSNTAAITSLKFEDYYGNNLVQYSTASLYGISKS